MTILEKEKQKNSESAGKPVSESTEKNGTAQPEQLTEVESQFKHMLDEFRANTGFSVNTSEPAVDTMIEVLSSKNVMVSLTVLLSYIRYCVNHGLKKDITIKIGYNKPPSVPMNFALNEEMIEDIYPGDVVEIN